MPDAAPPETTPPPLPNQQANLRGSKIMAVILLAVPLVLLVGKDCGEPEGSVRVDGGPRTPFTLTPTECDSMQPFGRMGANLHGNRFERLAGFQFLGRFCDSYLLSGVPRR